MQLLMFIPELDCTCHNYRDIYSTNAPRKHAKQSGEWSGEPINTFCFLSFGAILLICKPFVHHVLYVPRNIHAVFLCFVLLCLYHQYPVIHIIISTLIARFMGPSWGPSVADRTQVGPMLAPWPLLCGNGLGRREMTPVHNNEFRSIMHQAIIIPVFVRSALLAFTPLYECWNSNHVILRPFKSLAFFSN